MNEVAILEQQKKDQELLGGEIFQHSDGTFYIVARSRILSKIPLILISLIDGNLWSSTSLFSANRDEFKRIYGTVTITTE